MGARHCSQNPALLMLFWTFGASVSRSNCSGFHFVFFLSVDFSSLANGLSVSLAFLHYWRAAGSFAVGKLGSHLDRSARLGSALEASAQGGKVASFNARSDTCLPSAGIPPHGRRGTHLLTRMADRSSPCCTVSPLRCRGFFFFFFSFLSALACFLVAI